MFEMYMDVDPKDGRCWYKITLHGHDIFESVIYPNVDIDPAHEAWGMFANRLKEVMYP